MREIFVFGSNTEGKHGKGAALEARLKHGAIYIAKHMVYKVIHMQSSLRT